MEDTGLAKGKRRRCSQARAYQQKVATQDRRLCTIELVHRGPSTARVRRVEHVVVDERCGVDHLRDRGEPPVLRLRVLLLPLVELRRECCGLTHQAHEHRAHALARARVARPKEMLRGGG